MAKTFTSFLTESVDSSDLYKESTKIIEFLAKKLGQNYTILDGQNYTNTSGNYFGFLFVSKTDNSAIRINWEGNKFHSINFWLEWDYKKDPTKEIFIEDAEPGKSAFAKLLPDIAAVLKDYNSFDEEETVDLDESVLTEKKVEFEGQLYGDKSELVIKLYEDETDLEDICEAVKLSEETIKTILAKYLYRNGGNVSEIAEALGLERNEVRMFVGAKDNADTDITFSDKIRIYKGLKETVILNKLMKKGETLLDDTKYADPDIVFDEIDSFVKLTAKGLLKSLFITGQDSIGKAYNVEKILNLFGKKSETWEKVKSKANALEIYKTIWNNKDKIVVFDNNDNVFKDPEALNVIKSALNKELEWNGKGEGVVYTSDLDDNEEIEQVCQDWSLEHKGKEAIPSYFKFEGEIIFITNLTKDEVIKADENILTNCTCVDVLSSAQGIIKRLETVLPYIKIYKNMGNAVGKEITNEEIKQEIFDFMSSDEFLKDPRIRGKELSFRVFDEMYKLRLALPDNWKELAYSCGC